MTQILINPQETFHYCANVVAPQIVRVAEVAGISLVQVPNPATGAGEYQAFAGRSTYAGTDIDFPLDAAEAMVDWLPAERDRLVTQILQGFFAASNPAVEAKLRALLLLLEQSLVAAVAAPQGGYSSGFVAGDAPTVAGQLGGASGIPLVGEVPGWVVAAANPQLAQFPGLVAQWDRIYEDRQGVMHQMISGTNYVGNGEYRSKDGTTGSYSQVLFADGAYERREEQKLTDKIYEEKRIDQQFYEKKLDDKFYEQKRLDQERDRDR